MTFAGNPENTEIKRKENFILEIYPCRRFLLIIKTCNNGYWVYIHILDN